MVLLPPLPPAVQPLAGKFGIYNNWFVLGMDVLRCSIRAMGTVGYGTTAKYGEEEHHAEYVLTIGEGWQGLAKPELQYRGKLKWL